MFLFQESKWRALGTWMRRLKSRTESASGVVWNVFTICTIVLFQYIYALSKTEKRWPLIPHLSLSQCTTHILQYPCSSLKSRQITCRRTEVGPEDCNEKRRRLCKNKQRYIPSAACFCAILKRWEMAKNFYVSGQGCLSNNLSETLTNGR